MLAQLTGDFPDDVRLVFRHYPLITIHDNAAFAVQAAEAAGLQGEFWAMHDILYTKQAEWTELSMSDFESWLLTEAEALELDVELFASDLVSDELAAKAQLAWETNLEAGLPGTPIILLNGWPYDGPDDYTSFAFIASVYAIEKLQFSSCPEMSIDPLKQYIATLHTEKGDIVIELFPEIAPRAVNSFIFLAENDWYDNVTFHRVLEGFMAQSGDPSGTGVGGPGYLFDIETSPEVTFDRPGLFAMANAGPGSNGSQFFITFSATPHLNGQFTIFGEVISGMDVVYSLTLRNPQVPDQPAGDLILDVSIEVR
ncbi:MAG: thioredoxin domain-containing protein [Chloroflexi bacterium]|nr:thioredoxin domain-containing protein [Chloroflexota bacterium]